MSGYMKVPTDNPDTKYNHDDSDVDISREISDQEDCASFADNEDNQESPLIELKDKKKHSKFSEFLRHRRKTRIRKDKDCFLPEQFELKKRPIPWKAIGYAIILFVVGTILLVTGSLIHIGHVDNEKYGDRLWPLIIFGSLMFIPGSYHVYLAVNVFLGTPGYSFDDIPEFD